MANPFKDEAAFEAVEIDSRNAAEFVGGPASSTAAATSTASTASAAFVAPRKSPLPSLDAVSTVSDDTDGLLGDMESQLPEAEADRPRLRPQPPTGLCACFSFAYFQPFFDVDTQDVVDRLSFAVWPLRRTTTFTSIVGQNPDLYGPFWLCSTLVFAIAAVSNMSSYVHRDRYEPWHYDFSIVPTAASIVYGYVLLAPIALWFACKHVFDVPATLVHLLSVYGYGMATMILGVLGCAIPNGVVAWLLLMLATVVSTALVGLDLWPSLQQHAPTAKRLPIAAAACGIHLLFGIVLMLRFF